MTKTVRVENADTSDYKVVVEVYEKSTWQGDAPDILVETLELSHPTAMVAPYITSTRYLVVKEKSAV